MTEKELQKRLEEIYSKAAAEAEARANEYFSKFKERDKKMLAKVKSGEMTKREYDLWKRNQIMAGEKWNSLVDELSDQLTHADETARKEINGSLPSFLAEGMNKALYEAEMLGGLSGNYGIIDKETALYLAKNNPELLPSLNPESKTAEKIRQGKIKKWNQQHITSEVTQGVLLGESMGKVAKRLRNVTDMDKRAAMRNARTSTGAAVNAGKLEGMKRNEQRGVPTEKMWLAILDTRTRHEHRDLDGQIKPLDEEFVSEAGYRLMYPRDPSADACMIYNCRCRIVSVPSKIKDIILNMYDREGNVINTFDADGNVVKAESYEEWKKGKPKAEPKKSKKTKNKADKKEQTEHAVIEPKQAVSEPRPFEDERLKKTLGKDYKDFQKLVEGNPMQYLYEKNMGKLNNIIKNRKASYFERETQDLYFYMETNEGLSKFRAFAHEAGHSFDFNMNDKKSTFKEVDKINEIFENRGFSDKLKDRLQISRVQSSSDEFLKAVREDIALYKDKDMRLIYKEFGKDRPTFNKTNAIQDFFDGAYSTRKRFGGWGHGDKYYDRKYGYCKQFGLEMPLKNKMQELGVNAANVEARKEYMRIFETSSELWANISSAVVVGGDELEYIKKYTPSAYKAFMKIIERNTP